MTFPAVSAGAWHSLFLDWNGRVYSCGDNSKGQAGHGNKMPIETPTQIPNLRSIVQISAGLRHSLFLEKNGKVYACGSNDEGQTGHGNMESNKTPKQIPGLRNIVQISAASFHSLFLDWNRRVYASGNNNAGQTGHGSMESNKTPKQIPNLRDIVQISAGFRHSLFLKKNGKVYACGSNDKGQTGHGIKMLIETPTQIPNLRNIVQISAGVEHSLFLDENGKVYACGANTQGQLGLSATQQTIIFPAEVLVLRNIVQTSAGNDYSLFLDENGKVYACGANMQGQLGLSATQQTIISPIEIPKLHNIVQISAGITHNLFLDNFRRILVLGSGEHHKLGTGRNGRKYRESTPKPLDFDFDEKDRIDYLKENYNLPKYTSDLTYSRITSSKQSFLHSRYRK